MNKKNPQYIPSGNKKLLRKAFMVYIAFLVLLAAYSYQVKSPIQKNAELQKVSSKTLNTLNKLVKTKYFRMIRLNLKQECPLMVMNKICKSNSCTVCRCNEQDIPSSWKKTDRVVSFSGKKGGLDVWDGKRESKENQKLSQKILEFEKCWVWHVEDEENDKGEYFDINTNVESYTSYNGSYIWQLIYEENCFQGKNRYEQMCTEERTLYKVISGLHTSISSHLSNLYRNMTSPFEEWADTGNYKYHTNHSEYAKRVLAHPDRVDNLLFLYQILVQSIRKMEPYLSQQQFIVSDDITQDLKATQLLHQLVNDINGKGKWFEFSKQYQFDIETFFGPNNPKVKEYQRYFHNISRILNCVDCQKCRLFGKMQTYGVGTALKILLGYQQPYKRNQIVALFNTLNKITISVSNYFNSRPLQYDRWLLVKIYASVAGALLVFAWIVMKIDMRKKIKERFRHVFPKDKQM